MKLTADNKLFFIQLNIKELFHFSEKSHIKMYTKKIPMLWIHCAFDVRVVFSCDSHDVIYF